MKPIELFAIRHEPSGLTLPAAKGRAGRGGSWVEPSAEPPRFFHSERSAKIYLTIWLQGQVECSRGGGTYDAFGDDDYYEVTQLKPVASRRREEMKIVCFHMVEAP